MSKKKYEYPENLWDTVVQRSKELKGNRIQKLSPDQEAGLEFALSCFPEEYETVIRLRYKESLSEKKIAERMNLEADRVHRMILMGVKYLAKPQYIIYVVEGLENHNRNLVVQKERSIENAKRLHPDLPENILEEPISFLKFNTRIYNALKRHKVDTVGDLLDALRLPKWIQSFSNIGEQSQREIVQKMESLGLADNSYAEVIAYIKADVLNIVNGKLNNPENVDLFVNICALYAEKYGEECIEIIDAIDNDNDKYFIFSRYLTSFEWRNKENLPVNQFNNWLMKNQLYEKAVWRMLISNSMKVNHPFNADYLHELLYKFSLNKRDYVWTIYINELKSYNNDNRLIQLIEMYASGQTLDISDDKQIELMLTLFGWLLTSSNRKLRDYTSKAMIEILKDRVELCSRILKKFDGVNDPYVLQRLYGIVFGACCRCSDDEDIQDLAEYVYCTIFDKDMVYPDILLRDYARMIIERFLYENPEYTGIIKKIKIIPPYNSEPIPEINDQNYLDKHYEGGMYRLISSMKFEGMGIYGDFGRYVFQGVIKTFDINESKVWNYAVSYILNDLGYSEDLFGEYDLHCSSGRNETIKTERIGKKYQWIMMYNILARIADHCQMLDRWSSDNNNLVYDGAWQLYVRNFDPTLICNNIKYDDMPVFEALKSCSINAKYEHSKVNVDSEQMKSDWMNTKGIFFDEMKNMMILSDEDDTKWISLTRYYDTGRKMIDRDRLYEWSWAYAYFVSIGQAEQLVNCITNNRPVITNATASFHQETNVYNKEYPWAPSYKCSEQYAEVEVDIETGEEETITENIPVPNYSKFMQFITKYSGEDGEESDGTITIPNITYENKTVTRKVRKKIGNILHATTDLLWECQYDATIDETVTRSMPCAKIINTMHLKQLDMEGFFYNSNHEIVAFDTNLTQDVNAVVIRKDVLDEFLAKTNMKLIWIMDAEKEVDRQSHDMVKWSEWEGVFVYEGDFVSGEFKCLK